jgi:energy-converting hydrogenase Eha subunit H
MNQDLKLSQLNKEIEREFLTPFFINIDLSMYKIISNISLIIGALATGTIFFHDFLLIGLFLSLLGFMASIFAIFYETKYQMQRRLFSKSFIGLFLSSIPVLYIMIVILIFKD